MRASLTTLLALAFAVPAPAEEKPPAKFESTPGGYRVRFPGEPTVEVVPAKDDKPARTTAMFAAEKEATLSAVVVTELTGGKSEADTKLLLDGNVERVVAAWGMKALSTKKVEFGTDKLPARDVRAANPDEKVVSRSLFILDAKKGRLYLVSVHSGRDVATGKFADAFLDSFELIPKK